MMDWGDIPDSLQETTTASIDGSLELLESWHNKADGRIKYAFAPRFVLSCTQELLSETYRLSRKYGVPFHSHASENSQETQMVEQTFGVKNVRILERRYCVESVLNATVIRIFILSASIYFQCRHRLLYLRKRGTMTEGRPHRFAKKDANQREIVDALRQLNFRVIDTSPLGGKVLDLFVCGFQAVRERREWLHIEIKMPGGKLTEGEAQFFAECPECPAIVAYSVEDVLEWFSSE